MTDEEKFIESLYEEANEDLKEVYRQQKESRDDILKEIAMIMLTYTIIDGIMSIKKKDKDKVYKKLSGLIITNCKNIGNKEVEVLNNILESTIKKTFNFYSYNKGLKDIKKIIESNFKGKHFSERVWNNEQEVAKHLYKQVNNFLNGKINVNQIKNDIEKTFNTSAYNSKRLVETEVSRVSGDAFDRFCVETGVKKVRYNTTLDNRLCDDCAQYHDKIYDFKNKIERPRHPMCRCFYTIEDDSYKNELSKHKNSDILSSEKWLKSNFSTQKKFDRHIEKHLSEYGDITSEDYLNTARDLLAAPLSDDVEGFISEANFIYKYRHSTNDFAIGRNDKNVISTLYKPIKGYEEFANERELFEKKG